MDISWDEVRLFLAIAELGSVNKAAKALKLGQPTVSRRLAALEYSVGNALFRRSARGVSLTTVGERLLIPARKMAEWAGEVGRAAESREQSPRGLVRITSSPWACFDFLAPFAAEVATRHPGLRLEILSSVDYLDLTRGEADLAIRMRPPTQTELVVVKELTLTTEVLVAESLLARLPKRPQLKDLPWVAWARPHELIPPNPQLERLIPGFTPAFTSDNFLVMIAAAEAGVGAIVLARPAHRFSRPSALRTLPIPLGEAATTTIYVVAARSALDVPRIRRVSELLVEALGPLSSAPKPVRPKNLTRAK
ncbi:MAG: LysR family transcriptional regulator [Myxococcaceae bacterium]|jgi:DNA-binding transcriptional LysR family regulator|nr:LysR family transcriptional regulator [Myxococcaceae bacterium]